MKIELKSIKISEHMSEETTAFTADIFVNGVKVGYAKNHGHGGSTDYHALEMKRDIIARAEAHCLTLPPIKYPEVKGMRAFEIPMDLENFIDQLVEDEIKKKEFKKLEKKMVNSIIWGIPGGASYSIVKFNKPLSQILPLQLQVLVNQYKKELKEGETFINTNFEALGIKL
jgi:hypothetical protein